MVAEREVLVGAFGSSDPARAELIALGVRRGFANIVSECELIIVLDIM